MPKEYWKDKVDSKISMIKSKVHKWGQLWYGCHSHTSQSHLLSVAATWAEAEGGWRCRPDSKISSWQTTAHRQNLAQHLFLSIKFCQNTTTPICVCISYGCFHINVPNCTGVLNYMACKAKILTLWPLIEKLCWPSSRARGEILFLTHSPQSQSYQDALSGHERKILKFLFVIHFHLRNKRLSSANLATVPRVL